MPTQSITLDYADPRAKADDRTLDDQAATRRGRDGRPSLPRFTGAALGWFSLGLGLAELAAPRLLTRAIGVPGGHQTLVRLLGLRELTSGLGILTQQQSGLWLRSRVWGDMMDLAVLGAAFAMPRTNRAKLLAATAAVAGVTWLDLQCSRQAGRHSIAIQGPIRLTKTVTVKRSADDLYRFWRDFQNLPTVFPHLTSVQTLGDTQSHWSAKAPGGVSLEWDAEVVGDTEGQRIQWRSLENAQLKNEGSVQFEQASGGRGTVVRVELQYDPPAGQLGWLVAKLLGRDPSGQLQEGLRRFKQHMEAGEIPTTEGQPAGHAGAAMFRH
jgi:uncharacterized membrane protein